MSSNILLNIVSRQVGTKGDLANIRLSGSVPGVVYGYGNVSLNKKEIEKEMAIGGMRSKIAQLKLANGDVISCILRDVQYDPLTDDISHVDFQKVTEGVAIKINLNVRVINEDKCVGIKRGGILNLLCKSMEVKCDPSNIPEGLMIDVSDLEIGKALHIADISLPEGVEPTDRSNFAIAVLAGSSGDDEDDASGKDSAASA